MDNQAIITKNVDGSYSAHIPSLSAHTQWETRDELISNIYDAVDCTVESESLLHKNYASSLLWKPLLYLNMDRSVHAYHD